MQTKFSLRGIRRNEPKQRDLLVRQEDLEVCLLSKIDAAI